MVLHSLLGQRRRERIEPEFERPRHFESVGAELGRGFDEYPRLTGDQGIAEARLGAFVHTGDIAQTYGQAAARAGHRLRQRVYRGAGGLGAADAALGWRFEITAPPQS